MIYMACMNKLHISVKTGYIHILYNSNILYNFNCFCTNVPVKLEFEFITTEIQLFGDKQCCCKENLLHIVLTLKVPTRITADNIFCQALAKSVEKKQNSFICQLKHMLWILKRTWFFLAPKHMLKIMGKKIFTILC